MSVFSDPRWSSAGADWVAWPASRPVASAWLGHIPFAHWLVGAARPDTVVELGTMNGASYAAFCEAVRRHGLPTRCWAVDHWKGDPHAGAYGDEVYASVAAFNAARYADFSTLLRMPFADALQHFEDSSIDILHVDGFHTYEAARNDFHAWKSKLSSRAIVLFHDVAEYRPGFGVHQFWNEISKLYPNLKFDHSHGLGVLAVGKNIPADVGFLFDGFSQEDLESARYTFERLGRAVQLGKGKSVSTRQEDREYVWVDSDYSLREEIVVRILAPKQETASVSFVVIFDDPTAQHHYSKYSTTDPRDAFGFADSLARERGLKVVVQIADEKTWNGSWGKLIGFDPHA